MKLTETHVVRLMTAGNEPNRSDRTHQLLTDMHAYACNKNLLQLMNKGLTYILRAFYINEGKHMTN